MEILIGVLSALAVVGMCAICYLVLRRDAEKTASRKVPPAADLEARLRSIEVEWATVYDRLSRLAARITKERGLLEAASTAAQTPANNDGPSTVARALTRAEILTKGRNN